MVAASHFSNTVISSVAAKPLSARLVKWVYGEVMRGRRRGSSKHCTRSRFSGMPITCTCEPVKCQLELRTCSVPLEASRLDKFSSSVGF